MYVLIILSGLVFVNICVAITYLWVVSSNGIVQIQYADRGRVAISRNESPIPARCQTTVQPMSDEYAAVRAGSADVLLSAMFTNFRGSCSKSGCGVTTAQHTYARSKWNETDSTEQCRTMAF